MQEGVIYGTSLDQCSLSVEGEIGWTRNVVL